MLFANIWSVGVKLVIYIAEIGTSSFHKAILQRASASAIRAIETKTAALVFNVLDLNFVSAWKCIYSRVLKYTSI